MNTNNLLDYLNAEQKELLQFAASDVVIVRGKRLEDAKIMVAKGLLSWYRNERPFVYARAKRRTFLEWIKGTGMVMATKMGRDLISYHKIKQQLGRYGNLEEV